MLLPVCHTQASAGVISVSDRHDIQARTAAMSLSADLHGGVQKALTLFLFELERLLLWAWKAERLTAAVNSRTLW